MRVSLIIAGGGRSTRFKASVKSKKGLCSKLFLPLAGQIVLKRTLQAFEGISSIVEIILTLPSSEMKNARKLFSSFPKLKIIQGGKTRAESVWKGVSVSSKASDWIMVHDGARPLVSKEDVKRLLKFAKSKKAVILARKSIATIKESHNENQILKTLDRSKLYEAETPQIAKRELLLKAYETRSEAFHATDEASLIEAIGEPVNLLLSSNWNPKITHFDDLLLAEAYLLKGKQIMRTGFGRDLHRLVAGRKLMIGGIQIPYEKGSLGHSDGDVLLHSVSDAILGAISAGDIGDYFSNKDPKIKGIKSRVILENVLGKAKRQGWCPEHVDSVITLEKPKLGSYKNKIAKNLARLLQLSENQVSVKAKTMEGLGPEGQGLAISCEAIVTLKRSE